MQKFVFDEKNRKYVSKFLIDLQKKKQKQKIELRDVKNEIWV